MSDFMHAPQLSHPPDAPGGLMSQDKPLNHGMSDSVSGPHSSRTHTASCVSLVRQQVLQNIRNVVFAHGVCSFLSLVLILIYLSFLGEYVNS